MAMLMMLSSISPGEATSISPFMDMPFMQRVESTIPSTPSSETRICVPPPMMVRGRERLYASSSTLLASSVSLGSA